MRLAKGTSMPWRRLHIAAGRIVVAAFLLRILAVHPFALGQQSNATEDQVKAAYLLNFAKLAEWPSSVLPNGLSPLVIGVNGGEEEFLAILQTLVTGKTAGTHPLQVKAVSSAEELNFCHLIFFRSSVGHKRIGSAISSLTRAGVLLVGEDEDFLRQGGMINLVRDRGSIRFEVNGDNLDRSGIHFSAKILALAKTGSAPSQTTASNSYVEEPRSGLAAEDIVRRESPRQGSRRLEYSVAPEYPEVAKSMRLVGTVQVQALVRPDGTVKQVRVVGGHPLLADALVRAVLQWKYQPAPNETTESVKFDFAPRDIDGAQK
jgi:TonB family protein